MRIDIKEQCRGRWSGVLSGLGIDERIFNGRHQPCLFCGGKDRARWVKQKEFYICNQCGAMQPMDVAIEYLGVQFADAANEIRSIIGDCKMQPVKQTDEAKIRKQNEERLKRIWSGRQRITSDNPAGKYLIRRGLTVTPEADCFYHEGIPYFDNGERIGVYPAMFSRYTDKDGETCTYHITYLTPDGEKLDCSSPKKLLPTVREMAGGAIKLFKAGEVLGIAEGIETALAAHEDEGYPVWATANSGMMTKVVVPPIVKTVVIYTDEDKSFSGQMAAYTLAHRLKVKEGKDVKVVRLIGEGTQEVYIDSGLDMDYLDWLNINTVMDKPTA